MLWNWRFSKVPLHASWRCRRCWQGWPDRPVVAVAGGVRYRLAITDEPRLRFERSHRFQWACFEHQYRIPVVSRIHLALDRLLRSLGDLPSWT